MNVDFAKGNGLVPAIVQDERTSQVLMLGYMNAEALERTRELGRVTFYSRSRGRLWTKGEKSGNYLEFRSLKVDCDGDTLLVQARPSGPTCHSGADSCFGESKRSTPLQELESVIQRRAIEPRSGSYTCELLQAGPNRIAKKVGEEAVEVAIEATAGSDERLLEESADLLYHLIVLLVSRGLSLSDVEAILAQRRR